MRESTLQSKMALLCAWRHRATDRPTLAGWSKLRMRSGNGCELGRHVSMALGTPALATPGTPPPASVQEGAPLSGADPFGTVSASSDEPFSIGVAVAVVSVST